MNLYGRPSVGAPPYPSESGSQPRGCRQFCLWVVNYFARLPQSIFRFEDEAIQSLPSASSVKANTLIELSEYESKFKVALRKVTVPAVSSRTNRPPFVPSQIRPARSSYTALT